jgi:hypothetical protein
VAISRIERWQSAEFKGGYQPNSKYNKNSIVAVTPEKNTDFGNSCCKRNKFWYSCRKQNKFFGMLAANKTNFGMLAANKQRWRSRQAISSNYGISAG